MQAKSNLIALLFAIASPLTSSASAGPQKFTTPAPPPAGKALVLVYRERSAVGAATHPTLFVNDDFLADLHNGNYAPYEVPQGTVVFTAPAGILVNIFGLKKAVYYPPPDSLWPSDSACASLNWRHLAGALPKDVAQCKLDLRERTAGAGLADVYNPSRAWMKSEMSEALQVLEKMTARHSTVSEQPRAVGREPDLAGSRNELLRTEVEAGKTYYIEWSAKHRKMKVVDAATGAKKISGLHLAEHR